MPVIDDLGSQGNASLSEAFNEIYMEWLTKYHQWQSSLEPAETLALQAAEYSGLLARRLARQLAGRIGAAGDWQVHAVQFAFVALVDEVLLYQTWPAQSLWQETPLEQRLFGSRIAGERLPAQIDTLLKEQDPLNRDLAGIYLMCLTLGFRGRLRSAGGAEQCREWCRQLFAFAYRRDPQYGELANMLERDTLSEPARLPDRRLFPDSFRLLLIVGSLIFLLMVLGQLLWMDIRHKLEPGLEIPIAGWTWIGKVPAPGAPAGGTGDVP
ncbi:MAG: DotU family type IV/VI secretion system protein [Betaproteobacteria bacterium]|nr:DotU family type IV/VI secretion system protein [Betaproteobacteria bacterium]